MSYNTPSSSSLTLDGLVAMLADQMARAGIAGNPANGVEKAASPKHRIAAFTAKVGGTHGAVFDRVEGGDQLVDVLAGDARHLSARHTKAPLASSSRAPMPAISEVDSPSA